MVILRCAAALTITFALGGLCTVAVPVHAQSVLEQVENEVATIAAKTKSAVVTISDTQAAAYKVETIYETLEETLKRLSNARSASELLAELKKKLDSAKAARDRMVEHYGPASPQLWTIDKKIKSLQKQLSEAKAKQDASERDAEKGPQVKQYHITRGLNVTPEIKTGSGFSIGDGYIVTTADVLDGMKTPLVTTDTGIQIKAQIVGVNQEWNVGLLKLLANTIIPALTLGDSAKVAVGHFAISVGEQSGQANSAALLLVGGLRTEGVSTGGHFYPNLIQIAGTVGAGISGAPLVNSRGEVIGIMAGVPVTPWSKPNSVLQNIARKDISLSFADSIKGVMGSITPLSVSVGRSSGSSAVNPYIVIPQPSASDKAEVVRPGKAALKARQNVKKPILAPGEHLDTLPPKRVILPSYYSNSLSASAALGLNNTTYQMQMPLGSLLTDLSTPVFGAAGTAPVTNAGFAVPINALKPILEELKSGKAIAKGWIGIAPQEEITTTESGGFVLTNRRVFVEGVYPNSPAAAAGILPGDTILSLNGMPAQSANDVRELSQRLRVGDSLKIVVRRNAKERAKESGGSEPPRAARRSENSVETEVELRITERPTVFSEPLVLPKEKE